MQQKIGYGAPFADPSELVVGNPRRVNAPHALRLILIMLFVMILPVGLYHRLKSQATREKLDRRQEGLLMLATLRPLGAAFWLGLLAWMIEPDWMAWSSVSLPVGVRWV